MEINGERIPLQFLAAERKALLELYDGTVVSQLNYLVEQGSLRPVEAKMVYLSRKKKLQRWELTKEEERLFATEVKEA